MALDGADLLLRKDGSSGSSELMAPVAARRRLSISARILPLAVTGSAASPRAGQEAHPVRSYRRSSMGRHRVAPQPVQPRYLASNRQSVGIPVQSAHGPATRHQWPRHFAAATDVAQAASGVSTIVHAVNPPGYRNWGKLGLATNSARGAEDERGASGRHAMLHSLGSNDAKLARSASKRIYKIRVHGIRIFIDHREPDRSLASTILKPNP
jgi:hypothetical protein